MLLSLMWVTSLVARAGPMWMQAPSAPPAACAPHVAVVGAGWGGWGAAKALLENGCLVTILDTLPDPTGASPYLTPTGKPFEAGTRGFWKDYPNIEDLVASLGLNEEDVFTPFTNSSFYSPDGLEATAPVFSESAFPELPSPIGQVAATFALFERIPVADRLTMLGLLYATLDFTRDEKTFEAYDRSSAHELFIRMGLSKRLVDDFYASHSPGGALQTARGALGGCGNGATLLLRAGASEFVRRALDQEEDDWRADHRAARGVPR